MLKSTMLSFLAGFKGTTLNSAIFGSLFTVLIYIYGLMNTPLFWVLIGFSIIDLILGVYAAFRNKEFDIDDALNGSFKKFYIGLLVLLSALTDFALNYLGIYTQGIFYNFIMASLLCRELGSITKNADKAGLWVPQPFKNAIRVLQSVSEEKEEK